MNIPAKPRSAACSSSLHFPTAMVFAFAVGCGDADQRPPEVADESDDTTLAEAPDDAPVTSAGSSGPSARDAATFERDAGGASAPVDAGGPSVVDTGAAAVDAGAPSDPPRVDPPSPPPASDAGPAPDDAFVPGPASDGAAPSAIDDPCRAQFEQCLGSLDLLNCVPEAEACGLFPDGDGVACANEYTVCATTNPLEWTDCVKRAEECGLLAPGANTCADQFLTCFAENDLISTIAVCTPQVLECGLIPISLSPF